MKLNLSSKDVLQLSKAIKGGCLDTDKVECLKALVDGYNPPREIKDSEIKFYLTCLKQGWGFVPNSLKSFIELCAEMEDVDKDLYDKWMLSIEDGTLYKEFIKNIYIGLLSMKGLGGRFILSKNNFDWMNKPVPVFD